MSSYTPEDIEQAKVDRLTDQLYQAEMNLKKVTDLVKRYINLRRKGFPEAIDILEDALFKIIPEEKASDLDNLT